MGMSPKQTAAIVAVVIILSVLITVSVIKQQAKNASSTANSYNSTSPDSPYTSTSPDSPYTYTSPGSPYSPTASSYNSDWLPAKATWYGPPTGAGPVDNGGACGFKHTYHYPFSSMTSCGNQPIFKDGKGCGACYQIRCLKSNHPACSGNPQTVMITDMNYYPVATYHFDLSGTAFGSMANWGLNDKLRHAGIIDMQFRRVPCNFPGLFINFHVQHDANPNYLAVLVEYANKDGTVVQVDLMEVNSGYWVPMRESWGDIWRMDSYRPLKGPFSFRLRSDSDKMVVATDIIPRNWRPDTDYRSYVQFN